MTLEEKKFSYYYDINFPIYVMLPNLVRIMFALPSALYRCELNILCYDTTDWCLKRDIPQSSDSVKPCDVENGPTIGLAQYQPYHPIKPKSS